MSIEVNQEGVEYAKWLIGEGRYVLDKHGDWDEINPGTEAQDEFIRREGMQAFGRWHLGLKPGASYEDKSAYSFPYGDYTNVYRSGLIAAEERAAQFHHGAIEAAAKELLALLPEGE